MMILLTLVIAIQFIRPARNQAKDTLPSDITRVYSVPPGVHAILQKSCYDCHSNNTNYPWYNTIQPVSWWLSSHITDGKAELNFSVFGDYTARRQTSKLKAINRSVEDSSMPLPSYLWIHWDATLSEDQRKMIRLWAEHTLDSIGL